jgi:dTDP-4-amino-4,6-dideoxygalactose transaminase
MVGYNYRMTDIQGAVGLVQLKKLNAFIEERNTWAAFYQNALLNLKWLRAPFVPDGYKHGWQSYVTFIDESKSPMKRNDIMEYLQSVGIATRPGTHAVHMLDVYKNHFGIKPSDYPGAFAADQYSMSIPLHNRMSKDDYEYIVYHLHKIESL